VDEADPLVAELDRRKNRADTLVRQLGSLKRSIREFAAGDAYFTAWLDANRFDEFDRRVSNLQAVVQQVKPHAVCGWCKGDGCEKCRQTGMLPYSLAEAAPQS